MSVSVSNVFYNVLAEIYFTIQIYLIDLYEELSRWHRLVLSIEVLT